jgi:tetratricopeptide (TPR) repeat protein
MRAAIAVIVIVALASAVRADPEPGPDPADARFRAATARAATGDRSGALADFVAIADTAPDSPWADDALVEAARLAEQQADPARAGALLTRMADRYPASRSARWARAHAAQLAARAVPDEWRPTAAEHDAVIRAVGRHGDPTPHLDRLAALLRARPGYPREHAAQIWLGDAWSRQGEWARALGWYRDALATAATPDARRTARLRSVSALVALDRFADADAAIDEVASDPAIDPHAIARARRDVDRGRVRHRWRIAAWLALAMLAVAALIQLRRATGSMRATAAALARPPVEVWFLAPIAVLGIAAAASGNVMVARAVRWVAIGGVGVTWLSGAVLRATPAAGPRRIALHIAAIALAGAALVYLVISSDRLLDMLVETWRHGPDPT